MNINSKKNLYKRLIYLLILTVTTITIFGCTKSTNSIATPKKSFEELAQDIFKEMVITDSITLNYTISDPDILDIKKYPNTLGTVSFDEFESQRDFASSKIVDICQYEYDTLSEEEQVLYDTLIWYFKSVLGMRPYDLYSEYLNPITGIQSELPILLSEYHFNDKEDIDTYLAMLPSIYDYFKSICDFEHAKSENNLFMSRDNATSTIQQCEEFISDSDTNLLVRVFDEKIDSFKGLSQNDINKYKEQNKGIVENSVIPAYQLIIDTLSDLKDTGVNQAGLCNFENGTDYYEKLIQYNVGTSRSIDNIITVISNTVSSDISTLVSMLTENPSLATKYEDTDYGVTDSAEIISTLQEKISSDFPEINKINYEIKSVPTSLEDFVSPAMFIITPIDNYNNNTIYINKSLKYINTPLFTSLAHEAWPGHLYQNAYFCQHNKFPVLGIIKNVGYLEGWASYVTMLSYGYSEMDSDLAKLASCNNSLSLCLSARTDIGIHYENWTKEDVSEYFKANYCELDEESVNSLYNIIISTPGNYVTYALGYIEIRRMEESAKASLGDEFSLKDFNKFILDMGPIPFDIITEKFEEKYGEESINTSSSNLVTTTPSPTKSK